MKIKEIDIKDFRSLKKTHRIDLSAPLITLVGKNGSGKTNVLDLIVQIFDGLYYDLRRDLDFKINLELEKEDIKMYGLSHKCDENDFIIEAYISSLDNQKNSAINTIKSPFMRVIFDSAKDSIYTLSDELKKYLKQYFHVIKKFTLEEDNFRSFSFETTSITSEEANYTNYDFILSSLYQSVEKALEEAKKMLGNKADEDIFILTHDYMRPWLSLKNLQNFHLKYKAPVLTKFEQKHIIVDEAALKKEIDYLNNITAELREKIHHLSEQLQEKIDHLVSIFYHEEKHSLIPSNSSFDLLLNRVLKLCNPKVYYLRGENNHFIFKDNRRQADYHRLSEQELIKNYLKSMYTLLEQSEMLEAIEKQTLTSDEKNKLSKSLENFMNENLPQHESEMIEKIIVSQNFEFFIQEKNGDVIPFSQTNAGRKWYFSYFFVKGCLKPGDILLMDEPANSLHPEAQSSILKDLEQISRYNKILLTTHSPYMISQESFVYYVEMTNEGTVLHDKHNRSLQNIVKDLKFIDSETLIALSLINNQLCSREEIGRKIKDVLKQKGITQKTMAEELGIDERYLRKKLTGEYLTYEDTQRICSTFDLNPLEIILKQKIG